MSAHTPGPWWVFDGRRLAEDDEELAVVESGIFDALEIYAKSKAHSAEEHHGNARLIAAAPDMLDALKAVLSAYNGPTVDAANAVSGRMFAVRAAIEKAEGR